jgi:hypothetical protein
MTSPRRHEIPTHLNVEDKLLFGLTARECLFVLVGGTLAYGAWDQWPAAPAELRMALISLCGVLTTALVFIRPFGRPLEEWLLAGLLYASRPRQSVWRPREPEPTEWRLAGRGWQEFEPSLAWASDEDPAA